MTTAINRILSDALEADNTDSHDTVSDNYDTAADDFGEQDFFSRGGRVNYSSSLNSNMETLPIHLLTSKNCIQEYIQVQIPIQNQACLRT